MKRWRMLTVLMAVSLLVTAVLAGCENNEGKQTQADTKGSREVLLYFGNADQSDLVTETLKIPENEKDPMGYTLDKLLAGPTDPEHKRIIRSGTKLIAYTLEDGTATVNLSEEFYNNESISDVLAVSSVVKTLCSFSDVKKVNVLVDGEEVKGPSQKPMGEIKDEDLVFDAGNIDNSETTIKLYFSDNEAMYLGSETRKVQIQQKESTEKIILQELLKGPQTKQLVRTIPAETKILSVETKDGVCFVNLSNEFITKHSGGTSMEQMTIYSIVDSLTELSHVDKVQFLIEGKKKDVFIHMIFNEPFERDISLVKS